jgi:hypothetical protein
MKFRRVSAIAVAAIAILAARGTGLGATRDPGPSGIYSIPGGPQHSPLVVVDAVDHGHVLGPGTTVACKSSPAAPAGVPEKSTLILRIAGRVKISAHKDLFLRRSRNCVPARTLRAGGHARSARAQGPLRPWQYRAQGSVLLERLLVPADVVLRRLGGHPAARNPSGRSGEAAASARIAPSASRSAP